MLEMFKHIFGLVSVSANAASNVAKAGQYHSMAYEKTSLLAAAAKYRDQKKEYDVSEEDIAALLS
jgi:hypothetical protein